MHFETEFTFFLKVKLHAENNCYTFELWPTYKHMNFTYQNMEHCYHPEIFPHAPFICPFHFITETSATPISDYLYGFYFIELEWYGVLLFFSPPSVYVGFALLFSPRF